MTQKWWKQPIWFRRCCHRCLGDVCNVWHDTSSQNGNFELSVQGFRFLFLSCSFGSLAVTSKSESPPLFDRAIALSLIKPDQIPPIFRLSLQFVSKWALTFGLKIPLSGHPSTYPPSTPIPIHISTHTSTPNTCIVHTHIIALLPQVWKFSRPYSDFFQAPRDVSYSCLVLSLFTEVDPLLIFSLTPFKVSRWRKAGGVDTDKLKLMATSSP